ncbi:sulfatase [Paenibacillus sp. 1P07SE]|uniref:sulfatase n=1 Tax=Paenibacillus sp. 1P07SE TaxID=3132209 RepID=UPI0039A464B4
MKTILILLDTLNRRHLAAYGSEGVARTPNIDRLAERSIVFDQHWSGSLPCMPARRDILTGRAAFLEKGWGAIEPYDRTLPEALRGAGCFSHIATDHYHYFATGGENYCQAFDTWDFHRGQEDDPWHSRVTPPPPPDAYYGRVALQRELNKQLQVREADYPGPRTMTSACDWLERNASEDRFFLMVEAFDPHEPFDAPDSYLAMYGDDYEGPRYDWPHYGTADVPQAAQLHLRNRYAANLSMIDHWLGKLLQVMDRHNLWEDTLVLFTTDHGFLLGEHLQMGKNTMHVYNELAHLPLMVSLPGAAGAGSRIAALTQNIDLMPTILDYMDVPIPDSVQGRSLRPVIEGRTDRVREAALFGYHGMAVNLTDGRYTYMRAPAAADNHPCYSYTSVPTTFRAYMGREAPEQIETGRFLPFTSWPVFRIPHTRPGITHDRSREVMQSQLFDIREDYEQQSPISDAALERRMTTKMVGLMREMQAPVEQYIRLGLPLPDGGMTP